VTSALSGTARRFEATYVPLQEDLPELGQIALLAWDADIFGFRVADYRPGALGELADINRFATRLELWANRESVELVSCRIPGEPAALGPLLESSGFRFIEFQLRATLPRLRVGELAPSRITVRPVRDADHEGVTHIAGSAFMLGRYHADPRFPRSLADRRYRVWLERALAQPRPGTLVEVVGQEGAPRGFLHAELEKAAADIRLAAVDPEAAGIAGPELYRGALRELAARGAAQATARISAANTAVLNIYASLGFRFHEPELVFHWHAPMATHLIPIGQTHLGAP
jgi:ribosomal protein S18 acetylase RimI-like enzyme